MNTKSIIIVILVAVGIVVLTSLCLGLMTPGKPIEFLGLDIAKGDGHFIPPIAGALALAVGIAVCLLKPKSV